jgi:hypothetical protein
MAAPNLSIGALAIDAIPLLGRPQSLLTRLRPHEAAQAVIGRCESSADKPIRGAALDSASSAVNSLGIPAFCYQLFSRDNPELQDLG